MRKHILNILPHKVKALVKEFNKRKNIKLFEGSEVHCIICNSSFKKFMPFGYIKRQNAKCPNCGSLERHRLIWKYIVDKKLLKENISILHFAPEQVFYNLFSNLPNVNYCPCDLKPDEFDLSGKTKIIKADITSIPFDSNSFDFILCNHVLEHIPNDQLAMSELFRVLKRDGVGILQVPIDYNREKTYEDQTIVSPKERLRAFGHYDHVRWYGQDYKIRLSKAGFNVLEDDYALSFTPEDRIKYGFLTSEKIYLCRKTVDLNV